MQFPFKKLSMVALSAVLVFVALFTVPPKAEVSALTKSEFEDKIAAYEKKARQIKEQIAALQGDKDSYQALKEKLEEQVSNAEAQVDFINGQIQQLEQEIKEIDAQIEKKETEFKDTKDLLKERLCAIYIAGSYNEMSILLSAEDFSDFLARSELMRNITDHDTKLLDKLNEDIKEIEAQKKEIEAKKEQTESAKKTLEQKRKELNEQYATANSKLDSLSAQQSDLEDEAAKIAAAKRKTEKEWEAIIAQESDANITYDGKFTWPFQSNYYISSPYGYRSSGFHTGTDITCGGAYGKPIYAAADGRVISAVYSNVSYGNHLIIDHGQLDGNQYTTLYAHCSSLLVSYGTYVKRGQLIAYVGSTGNSSGPHLHFEVRVNGSHTNPMQYFR